MAAPAYLSIVEYLNTTYEPDLEYVDGQLVERKAGKWEHARIQAILAAWFLTHEEEWSVQTATDIRTRVAWTRVRLPDVLLVGLDRQPDVVEEPPVLAVEILSDGDTYAETQRKCAEYILMGAQAAWIISTMNRTARQWDGTSWQETTRLEVAGTAIYVELSYLWDKLDQAKKGRP
jgi:Uma2 family endonuclease